VGETRNDRGWRGDRRGGPLDYSKRVFCENSEKAKRREKGKVGWGDNADLVITWWGKKKIGASNA